MVDSVVSSREIYEDNAGDFPCFKAIFDMLGEVQHLGSTRFPGAEASLLRYQDVFDNGRQAVQFSSNETETCDCGIRQTMQHLLVCPMMNTACSPQDLTTANDIAIGCARHWEGTI